MNVSTIKEIDRVVKESSDFQLESECADWLILVHGTRYEREITEAIREEKRRRKVEQIKSRK